MMYVGFLAALGCAAAMMGREEEILPVWSCAVGIVVIAGCFFFGKLRRSRIIFAIGMVVLAGTVGLLRMEWAARQYEALPHYMANAVITLQGHIVTEKRSFPTEKGEMARYVVRGEKIAYAEDGVFQPMEGCLYLTIPKKDTLVPHTPIQFTGTVKEISYYRNDGMYDSLHRDKEQQIFLKAYSDDPASTVVLGEPSGWQYRVYRLREELTSFYKTVLSTDKAHMLSSLLFGGHYEDLPPSLVESFSTTGLIHILSVSGSHMALLLSVIQLIGKSLGLRQRVLFIISIVFVLAYGAMSEFTAPVVRSAMMGLIAAYSITTERAYVSTQALGIAMLAMLLYSPYLVYDLSFRLSCGASAGIILLQPRIMPYLKGVPTFLRNALGVCLCAQAFVLPIICANFFALPVYTVFANMTVAPVLDMVIVLGLGASLLYAVLPVAAQGILHVIDGLLTLSISGNYALAALPYSRYWVGAMPIWYIIPWYAGISLFFVPRAWRRPLGVMACVLALGGMVWQMKNTDEAKIIVFDLGNDQATCAIFPDKSSYVWYNKSEWSNPEQAAVVLTPALRYQGIFHLTQCTVTGKAVHDVGAQLMRNFTIAQPISYPGEGEMVETIVQGRIPYRIYATSQDISRQETGCVEIRKVAGFAEAQFPQGAQLLIIHGKTGRGSQAYTEWLEQAEALDIPVFSPSRDGQITGRYNAGSWTFQTYGGER